MDRSENRKISKHAKISPVFPVEIVRQADFFLIKNRKKLSLYILTRQKREKSDIFFCKKLMKKKIAR